MRILIVEDEKKVADFIRQGLREAAYMVDVAYDGKKGLQLAKENQYSLVILDWLLPGKKGIEICYELRSLFPHLPILMLTAKDSIEDKVAGLDYGADDYLTKPFSFEELRARIRALSRRNLESQNILKIDDLVVDVISRKVTRGEQDIYLSNKEYDLLLYFLRNKNRVITRDMLAKQVWHISFDMGTNYIDVYINYLRKKLDVGSRSPLIFTIRSRGYIMKEDYD